ncbi:MAG: GMC family oxidoreductase [Candidatus Heimdallarchaeota archaeon]|nr:GMC family oxidoreductase [Candidatus Heimdallarchaeota archaeon]
MPSNYDSIIIGSGISGATLARQLVQNGQKVLLLEKGGYHKLLGNHLAIIRIADRKGFRYTKEHLLVASGITIGGSSVISAGTAYRPPPGFFKKWRIDLENELNEAEEESGARVLPDELIGKGSLHLMEAGNRLGQKWERLPKFIHPEKCKSGCPSCMLGCKNGAKFTARPIIEEAKSSGLEIQKRRIDRVIIRNGEVRGVKPSLGHEIHANRVIISAGGIHSPIILQRSGFEQAGKNFFMDPMVVTYGISPKKEYRTIKDNPMSVGSYKFHKTDGILLSPIVDPWGLFLLTYGYQKTPWDILKIRHYFRLMGIMAKTKDSKSGEIKSGRLGVSISKKLSEEDKKRLEIGFNLSKEVLIEAGANPCKIFRTSIRGAHPGGSNSIGDVVNSDLETEIPNLFVCDASVLPHSMASPLVITLMAFAKRLGKHIINSS